MKNLLLILFVATGVLFTSCDKTENVIYDPNSGETLAFFEDNSASLEVLLGGESTIDVEVGVTTLSDQDRTVTVVVNEEESTIDSENYSLSTNDVVIPAGEYYGSLTITGIDVSLSTDPVLLVLDLVSINGGVVSDNSITVSVLVVCPIPNGWFTGAYTMEQISSQQDPFFPTYGEAFESQTVNVNQVTSTVREFNFSFFPTGFDVASTMTFTFDCGTIRARGLPQGGGLSCDGGATDPISQATSPNATYAEADLENDDVVIVEILNFEPDGGCGTGSYPVTLQFTKQ
ncbi:MAG: DUF1735 domain-containing protein [Flavobacteriaceae bacterium]